MFCLIRKQSWGGERNTRWLHPSYTVLELIVG